MVYVKHVVDNPKVTNNPIVGKRQKFGILELF